MGSQILMFQVLRRAVLRSSRQSQQWKLINMDPSKLLLILASLYQLVLSQPIDGKTSKTCQYKNNGVTYQINEGEVSEIKKSKVRVCRDGKNVLKKKAEVPLPWKYACNGCTVKGKVVCQGTVVWDLYRWWYKARCDRGRMTPIGRQWTDVATDPRFQEN